VRGSAGDGAVPSGRASVGLIQHELPLSGGRRLVLDVTTGIGWLVTAGGRPTEVPLGGPILRLAMLDWCWRHMPVPTATALWQIESAALALGTEEPSCWLAAASTLPESLHALRHHLPEFSGNVLRALDQLDDIGPRWGTGPAGQDRRTERVLLRMLIDRLRGELRAHCSWDASGAYAGAIDLELPGCYEAEWDRMPRFQVDPREHAVRARVSADSWSVWVTAQQAPRGRPDHRGPLWARLVDEATGRIVAEVALVAMRDGYAGRAALLDGPPARWHIDISGRREEPPRSTTERCRIAAQQALFRARLLERFSTVEPGFAEWAVVLSRRADRELRRYQAVQIGDPSLRAVRQLGEAGRRLRPFLAEELLDPARVALFVSHR
jgi:hypothetical protein